MIVLCGWGWAQGPRLDGVRLNLWPTPRVVPADGVTASTVRAELRGVGGAPVSDGTTVVFRIDGGQLGLGGDERRQAVTTTTVGGSATVYATSTTPGVATIFAELTTGQGRNQTTVAFVEEGGSLVGEGGVAHVRGGWVGYALDLALVEARDGAEVEFGSVLVTTEDVLQIDVTTMELRATAARVQVDDRCLLADELSYNLLAGQGVLRRITDEGVVRRCFDCFALEEREPDTEITAEMLRLFAADAAAWAVADGVSIYPQEKVVLRGATLYAGERKVLDLPRYWIIAMPGYSGTTHSGLLGVSSDGGIAVDFPYFYRVTETETGAVKIQRGASSGSVIARDDWSLALEEAYDTGQTEGSVSLVGLPRGDWGFEWRDQRRLGLQRDGYFTAYSPDHESWYFDGNVYQWSGNDRLNLTASAQFPLHEGASYAAGADWLTTNRPAGMWNASYRVGSAVGVRHAAGLDDGLVGQHQVYAALDFPRQHLGERGSLRPSLSNLFTWDTSGYQQNSLRGELSLRETISSDVSAWLSYQGQLTSGDNADGYEHLVNLDLRAYHGASWSSYFTGTYDLTDEELYTFGLVDWYVSPDWRVALAGTYYQVGDGDYDDFEVTVTRRIGPTEIGLRWSEESNRIAIELGNLAGLGFY